MTWLSAQLAPFVLYQPTNFKVNKMYGLKFFKNKNAVNSHHVQWHVIQLNGSYNYEQKVQRVRFSKKGIDCWKIAADESTITGSGADTTGVNDPRNAQNAKNKNVNNDKTFEETFGK